jgi:hypothetical protein
METQIQENPAKGKRSGLDFSKHKLKITDQDGLLVHYLKKPDTICDSIKFINTNGIMAVTGDYGNWIFCREFHPSPKSYVSEGYWREKLKISSCQEPSKFDPDKTEEEIKRRLKEDCTEEENDYYNDLLSQIGDGEIKYMYHAYYEAPSSMDAEYIPYVKSVDHWLLCIMDGFDEICRRMTLEQTHLAI